LGFLLTWGFQIWHVVPTPPFSPRWFQEDFFPCLAVRETFFECSGFFGLRVWVLLQFVFCCFLRCSLILSVQTRHGLLELKTPFLRAFFGGGGNFFSLFRIGGFFFWGFFFFPGGQGGSPCLGGVAPQNFLFWGGIGRMGGGFGPGFFFFGLSRIFYLWVGNPPLGFFSLWLVLLGGGCFWKYPFGGGVFWAPLLC